MSSNDLGAMIAIGMMAMIPLFLILMLLDVEFDIFSRLFSSAERAGRSVKRAVNPPKQTSAKVAYKKGFLLPGGGHFKGVMGGYYSADDVKNPGSIGFHAYSDFDKALAHSQEGNVLLEVLLSGEMDEMEQGYVAERQRVLQVIPYQCEDSSCNLLPTHFSHMENDQLWFLCPVHVLSLKGIHMGARLYNSIPFVKPTTPFVVETIDKLPWRFPWMAEQKIVVGKLKGKDKFVPTVIEESVFS